MLQEFWNTERVNLVLMQVLSEIYELIQEVNVVEPLNKSDHNIIKFNILPWDPTMR